MTAATNCGQTGGVKKGKAKAAAINRWAKLKYQQRQHGKTHAKGEIGSAGVDAARSAYIDQVLAKLRSSNQVDNRLAGEQRAVRREMREPAGPGMGAVGNKRSESRTDGATMSRALEAYRA